MRNKSNLFIFFIVCLCLVVVVYFIYQHNHPNEPVNPTQKTDKVKEPATRDENMALGNPSAAGREDKNNFLVERLQYTLSYNNNQGHANWVSWHLSTAWKGGTERTNDFQPDTSLPTGFYRVTTKDFSNSGFDRGHLCPSDDRDGSTADNKATFLMDNIIAQAPKNNEQTWKDLEEYCRKLIYKGNELFIIAGAYGRGGINKSGTLKQAIGAKGSGRVIVPARVWKIVVVLPNGSNDLSRISTSTQLIAVDMPNTQTVTAHNWEFYKTSVDAIEAKTGYDFLSAVPVGVQAVIEGRVE